MQLQFAAPIFLLLILPAVYILFRHIKGRLEPDGVLLFSSTLIAEALRQTPRVRFRTVTTALRIISITLLAVALARPQLGRAESIRPKEGIDVALALDLSFSMSERDMGGKSRLEAAKDVIRQFVGGREGDRIGLVVFSAEGATHSPLTLDYPVFLELLDQVDHGKLPEGTAVGNGIATSVNLLRDSRARTKVVILVTDGQNNAGDIGPEDAARMAQLLGIRVYTIGVGGQRAGGSRGGAFAPSAVDETTLRAISEATGASYFKATDPEGLREIYELIGRLEKSQVGEIKYSRVDDLWLPFLTAAFVLLFGEIALSNTIFRRFP